MRIVLFLNLCSCNHLDSLLLDVLELTGALDGFHDLVPLSSLDVEVVVEGVGSSVSLSTSNSSVQVTWNLLGILIVRAPRGDGEHRLCVQLRLVGLPSWVLLGLLH
jgi:hypothetical protein